MQLPDALAHQVGRERVQLGDLVKWLGFAVVPAAARRDQPDCAFCP